MDRFRHIYLLVSYAHDGSRLEVLPINMQIHHRLIQPRDISISEITAKGLDGEPV